MLDYSFLPTCHAHFCSSDLGGINALIAFAAAAAAVAQAKPLAASLIDELHSNTQWQQQLQQVQQQQQLVRTASQLDL